MAFVVFVTLQNTKKIKSTGLRAKSEETVKSPKPVHIPAPIDRDIGLVQGTDGAATLKKLPPGAKDQTIN